jgi:hypothetical protein
MEFILLFVQQRPILDCRLRLGRILRRQPSVVSRKFLSEIEEEQMQIPIRLRSGQAFAYHPQTEKRLGPRALRMTEQLWQLL